MSGGAVADDFDNDGYLDIFVSTWDTRGQIRFFRNNRDGTFTEHTAEARLLGLYGGLNMVQADYDNDGDVDLLVLRGAWLRADGRHPNSLLRNDGEGTFTDVTFDVGLGEVHYPSPTAAWGDYDNDGDLDLYVGNETSRALVAPSQLFRNNGDGTFTDVAEAAAVMNYRYAKAAVWGDYDGDGLQDLYVSNYGGSNRLYRNTGRGFFIDEAQRLGVAGPTGSFPAWFWDVDNDGLLDLYVSAYTAGIEHLAASALGRPAATEASRLYRGTGRGRFEEVSGRYGLTEPTAAMGSNFGDLDNDGYPDFYLGTGYPGRRGRRARGRSAVHLPPCEQRRQLRGQSASSDPRARRSFAHRTARYLLARHRQHADVHRSRGGSSHPRGRGRTVLFDPRAAAAHVRLAETIDLGTHKRLPASRLRCRPAAVSTRCPAPLRRRSS